MSVPEDATAIRDGLPLEVPPGEALSSVTAALRANRRRRPAGPSRRTRPAMKLALCRGRSTVS
jgi:hypothetical protein